MINFDQTISSKLDGLFDDRPRGQALAIFAAKYLLPAFFGATIVIYPWLAHDVSGALRYDFMFITSVVVAQLMTVALSFLIGRRRPYEVAPDMWHLPIKLYTPSFPSGHATMAFATAVFLIWYWHPAWYLAGAVLLVACGVGLARIVVGVHYLSDVLAGAILGSVLGWLTLGMLERLIFSAL